MLTQMEIEKTREELQENYRRLAMDEKDVLRDLGISSRELRAVLNMNRPNPSQAWMVRDYLEDKLVEKGVEMYPFSRLADHRANLWYSYETPWRKVTKK